MSFQGYLQFTITVLALGTTFGCATNPYKQFYNASPYVQPDRLLPVPLGTTVKVLRGTDIQKDSVTLMENGQIVLGFSGFRGRSVGVQGAIEQAKAVGATSVVLYGKYVGTITGSIPVVVPNPSVTVHTSSQGVVNLPNGSVPYSGNATTTLPGGSTTYNVPYHVDQFEQSAIFCAMGKVPVFGAMCRDLNNDEKTLTQGNHGAVVILVVKDSPAFRADIIPGDIVMQLDDTSVIDGKHLYDLTIANKGNSVTLKVFRSGSIKDMVVKLNSPS